MCGHWTEVGPWSSLAVPPQTVTNPDQREGQGTAWGQRTAGTHLDISLAESRWRVEASCDAPDGRFYGNLSFQWFLRAGGTLEGPMRAGGGKGKGEQMASGWETSSTCQGGRLRNCPGSGPCLSYFLLCQEPGFPVVCASHQMPRVLPPRSAAAAEWVLSTHPSWVRLSPAQRLKPSTMFPASLARFYLLTNPRRKIWLFEIN